MWGRTQKRGGLRVGAGRPFKWQKSGKTKSVRIPADYVDRILRVVSYMDQNDGQLPPGVAFFTEENFPSPKFSPQFKEFPYPRNYSDIK
ncbi:MULTISPECIES: hypothetical protein [unclassified Microcoleus]|uniref:hypothetical protein n=1 Tax=unclassified Microcoleus TaxID=2642155 RepID=UPI0025DA125A|nr:MULTISPECIES: hypothetical protein [unclassified Microcoleus]